MAASSGAAEQWSGRHKERECVCEKNIATSYVDAGMTGDMPQRKRQRKTVDVAIEREKRARDR